MQIFVIFHYSGKGEDEESRKRMVCKVTNSIETFSGSKKTKGFQLQDKAVIINDKRGFQRLELQRNHPTVLQTSLHLVRSWRANVDVQLLLYENYPINGDPQDIAKVTDYIVGYISKGYKKQIIEKE